MILATMPALPAPETAAPRVPWSHFVARFRWAQGEHLAIVAPTGAGKTTLMLQLVELRRWVAIVATKPRDRTMTGLGRRGWRTIRQWPPPPTARRVVLWAPLTDLGNTRPVFDRVTEAMQAIYEAGSWCLVLDDLQGLVDTVKIGPRLRLLLLNARSVGVSVVAASQRPRWVPREVWTQSTHLFIGRCTDRDDLRQLSGLGHADTDTVRRTVQTLSRHEVLYVNTRTGELLVTQAPKTAGEVN